MGPVVTTRSGRLEGRRLRRVEAFRGIPFARPPVGELRLRPPEPAEPWTGVRSARRYGRSAPQLGPQFAPNLLPLRRVIGTGPVGHDEDCLYLNVWTPRADGLRRPVLVFLHGGAFVMGSGSTTLYSGAHLARTGGVVVVTLNYRLGALGYLNLHALRPADPHAPSNLGLRDQIAALEWVRDHIDAFGGDPENVTLFGESAGAMSVGALLGAPRAQGLFRRAILQSGAASSISSRDHARAVGESFFAALGVDPGDDEALRAAPVDAILRAQSRAVSAIGVRGSLLPWQPGIDADLLPVHPLDAIDSGLAKGIDVLIGTNRDEWKLFLLGDSEARRLDDDGLRERFARALPGTDAGGRPRADVAFETYAREGGSPVQRWMELQTDRVFREPATRLAELHAAHSRRTYAYLFTWSAPVLGACHGVELPFVFGTLDEPFLWVLPTLPGVRRLAAQVQGAWIAFARTGDPSHPGLPDWPPYDAKRRATMRLDRRCEVVDAPFESRRRLWAELG